jgi:hypothetical protein
VQLIALLVEQLIEESITAACRRTVVAVNVENLFHHCPILLHDKDRNNSPNFKKKYNFVEVTKLQHLIIF